MADASASTPAKGNTTANGNTPANAPETLPANTLETLLAIRAMIAQATAEMEEIMRIFLVLNLHPNMYANPDRQTAMLEANAERLTDPTKELKDPKDIAATFDDDDDDDDE
ncbi:hypothetical protein M5689_013190 [Euphorbia peplus]|nr:hypothetical protein M5689_013190 [Euphorbia peplus]